jgi:hypothetical protein
VTIYVVCLPVRVREVDCGACGERKTGPHGLPYLCFITVTLRYRLCAGLEYNTGNHMEYIRRVIEMVKLILDAGILALTAFVSSFPINRRVSFVI